MLQYGYAEVILIKTTPCGSTAFAVNVFLNLPRSLCFHKSRTERVLLLLLLLVLLVLASMRLR